MTNKDNPHYLSLLDKIRKVFGEELSYLSKTQEAVLNGLIGDRVQARKGDYSKVTLAELEGCRNLLYQEFSLAEVQ